MKKLFFLVAFVVAVVSVKAQELWFDAGLKGGYGITILQNKNLFDDNSYSHLLSGSYNVGGKVGINIGRVHGVTFDAMLSNQTQNFEYTIADVDYTNEIKWNNLDLYVLYRASMQGAYIELGPMFSNVRKVEQVDTGRLLDTDIDSAESYYSENYTSAVFGVGGYMAGNEAFTLMVGLRGHYALTDMISDRGMAPNPLNAFPATVSATAYNSYEETRPIFVEFLVELNFGIGHFAKTTCGGRSKFIGGTGRY